MSNTFENIVNLSTGKSDFTYKDIKKHCIVRGMSFTKATGLDIPNMSNWLLRHVNDDEDPKLIEQYDDWVEEKLKSEGNEYLIHPRLRLGYVGERSLLIVDKIKKPKKEVEPKKKREKDQSGLYKGTKKQYTFDLQRKNKTIDQVITKVTRKFPEAKVKSIKIWFNRSRKENA